METTVDQQTILIAGSYDSTTAVIIIGETDSFQEIATALKEPVLLIGLNVDDWNSQLSPWPYHMNRNFSFAGNGHQTLHFVTDKLLPWISEQYPSVSQRIICGYSLAGLFSLWAYYETGSFSAAGSFSGSLWFENWLEYARQHTPKPDSAVCLSLGNREHLTRNQVMATVRDNTLAQYQLLTDAGIKTVFQENEGNHFANVPERIVRGIRWLIENTGTQND